MVELSVDGAVAHLTNEWADIPDVELGLECFANEAHPKLKTFFAEVLESSIEPSTLKKGASLTSKEGVINSKGFVLSSDLAQEAKSKNIRVDAYILLMAAKQVKNETAKKELHDASNWLIANGPLYSAEWVSNMKQYYQIVQGSLASCFEMEQP